MEKTKKIRVRFAPSPTGFLHVGGLRSALYNYLFARKNNGQFILRIEDTDQKRYVKGALENLLKSLEWANLEYDEGVYLRNEKILQRGDFGPYFQSERLDIYQKQAEQLVEKGKAYYCFCLPERLEKMRAEQIAQKQAPQYDQHCLRNLSPEKINQKLKARCPATIRLKVEKGQNIIFEDLVRDKMSFKSDLIDDQILIKSDGYPTYHLANVVDDHLMKISHVIRGEEWLSSTPKHLLLYEAFGWKPPFFAHLPLLLNPQRKKLSKRDGDVALEEYIRRGYLREALINFVALLGWNPGKGETQEIFSLDELVKKFELSDVNKSGAVFDIKKLDWINSCYIKKLTLDQLWEKTRKYWLTREFYRQAPSRLKTKKYLKKVLAVEQERLKTLSEVGEQHRYFFQDVRCDKNMLRWKNISDQDLAKNLREALSILEKLNEKKWTRENLSQIFLKAADKIPQPEGGRGAFLWPLRVALTAAEKSPPPAEVAWVLGKKEVLRRLRKALQFF